MADLAAVWAALDTALSQRQPVVVVYHGRQRVLCPHALGWKAGRPLLLGYQTGGQTHTGTLPADPRQRWRCLYVDEIDHVDIADGDAVWGSADNYQPGRPFPAADQVTLAVTPTDPTPVR